MAGEPAVELQYEFPLIAPRPGELMPDENILVEEGGRTYRRLEGCHKGCGACCEAMIIPIDPRVLNNPAKFDDWRYWAKLHGVLVVVSKNPRQPELTRVEAYIPLTCKHLQEDKSCGVYGTEERPHLCSERPRIPADIIGTGLDEVCSYEWKEEQGDKSGV